MAIEFRECKGQEDFNTGRSKCILDPGKIKAVILIPRGFKIPNGLTADKLEELCHADRPNRIYPIKTVEEFAPTGGEANVNATGYGGNKITGYSAYTAALTLDNYDASLKANLMMAKGVEFDGVIVDEDNVLFGTNRDTTGLSGIPLSGVYPSGQDWDSSGQEANLIVNLMFKDYEKYIKTADIMALKFDVVEALKGLVFVDLVKVGENKYKLIEHFGGLNVTGYYADALSKSAVKSFDGGVSAVSYANGELTVTATGTPSLKKPSELQKEGIIGIEQKEAYDASV